MTTTKPTAKMRHCFNCGAELGVLAWPQWQNGDPCGAPECNREAALAEAEHRERAHDELDERMGWGDYA